MRQVRIQDTLSGELRPLEPREDARVGIYACGPTVYGPLHVGNARPYVVFSLLKRFLQHEGYEATFVSNVTDVNDKIYDAARDQGVSSAQLAREMTERYERDTARLGLGRPDREPKASETIDEIVALIEALIESGHAYATSGDVYFRVASFPEYGKLSNRSLEDMDQGEDDVPDSAAVKESPHDFALWKAHKPGEDTAWDTPWGRGRPGWHIECSAMAETILGLDFEIHGGGSDLVFPHHENEIAQTEAARGRPLARLWMHNGMVQFGDEKMSKSLGNIRSLEGALDEVGAEALVMYFVGGHYRQPIVYSEEALEQARSSVGRIRELGRRLDPHGPDLEGGAEHADRFRDSLADDFNTPAALAEVFGWVAEANRRLDAGERVGPGSLREMLWSLGLERLLEPEDEAPDPDAVRLLEERETARAERDFATADARRDELAARGWQVRDTPEGPRLVRAG
ncbi:MAG: cysteinyl-tRNA synthetase [Thermoleophilaceae bacterium]|jgi:cysteinyl-tRNA synthetase|nr:cysteinyl-tRNA synthetase [Thermoleophilaceae bacterium]